MLNMLVEGLALGGALKSSSSVYKHINKQFF